MNRGMLLLLFLFFLTFECFSQQKAEHIVINWPEEYQWKIVKQTHDENTQTSMIIPGSDSISNPSIIGSLTAYRGAKVPKLVI